MKACFCAMILTGSGGVSRCGREEAMLDSPPVAALATASANSLPYFYVPLDPCNAKLEVRMSHLPVDCTYLVRQLVQ